MAYETPMLSAFIEDVAGQTAYMQWSPVSTTFSPYFEYELQYKKSTDANYTDISTNLTQLNYTHKVNEAGKTYNYRLRPKLNFLYVDRDIVGSRNIAGNRDILPTIAGAQYGAYSNITLNLLYGYYLKGYDNEVIEIPKVYSADELSDHLQHSMPGMNNQNVIIPIQQ